MRLFFITSKLNFETAGGSIEEYDLMMNVWRSLGDEVTAVTTYSDANRIPHPLPYALKEERISNANQWSIQKGVFDLMRKYEKEADAFHVDGQFLYGAGLYRRLGGRVPVQAYFNRELSCWEPMASTMFPNCPSAQSLFARLRRGVRRLLERVIAMPIANGIDIRIYVGPHMKAEYEKFGMSPRGMIALDPVDLRAMMRENGVNEQDYRTRNKRSGPYTIFYSSRMAPGKGFDVLLAGFARVKNKENFRLVIGGGGPEERCVRDAVKAFKLEPYVELTGWMGKEELLRRHKEADIYVQTEWIPYGTSISLMYAMSFGLPCIVNDAGGLAWVAGPAALTFAYRDADDLARAIERLGEDRDLRERLSAGCYARMAEDDFDYRARFAEVNRAMRALVAARQKA